MKRISLFLLTAVSLFAAAGDVIFRQNTGTTITDRTVTVPSPMSNQIFGLSADTERPARFTIGSGLTLSGTSPDFTITSTGLGGTVTSVGLTLPASVFSVTGSPVTSAGVLAGDFIPQPANMIFAGPTTGGADIPSFRSIVATDLPFNGLPYVAGNSITITGNVIDTIQDIRTTAPTVQFGGIRNTPIGNITPSTGAFTTETIGASSLSALGRLAINDYPVMGVSFTAWGNNPSLQFLRANGTPGAETAVLLGDSLMNIGGRGWNGTAFVTGKNAGFDIAATENFTPTGNGAEVRIVATPNGSTTAVVAATITATGINATAIGATTPSTGVFTTAQIKNAGAGATLDFYRTTTPTVAAQPLSGINSYAFDGATDFASATINARSAEAWSTTNHGSYLSFRVTPAGPGGVLTEAAQITSTGINATAIGATTPSTGVFTNLTSTGTTSFAAGNFTVPGGQVMSLNSSNATGIYTRLTVNGVSTGFWGSSDQVLSGSPSNLAWLNATTGASMELYADGFRATAINQTPIGATTPSTGRFTSLVSRLAAGAITRNLVIENTLNGADNGPGIFFTNADQAFDAGAIWVKRDVATLSQDMQFATTPNWTTTAPAVRMTIQGGGNVGIGTTAPWAKLHVNGPYGDPSLSSSTTAIAAFHSDTSVQLLMGGYQTAPYGFWLQTNNNNGGSAYPILLNPIAGGAGVGTTNPTAQFHTTGSVRFEGLPGGTLVTDASGNVSAVAGGGGGGDKHYYFDTGMYVGHTNSAGGPDAVDLTAQIAAAGLNIPGVTVKAALIRSYTRLGPLPAGGYTASATTWCWGSVAGLDYGVVSGVLVNGGGAAVDSGFGICPLFDGHTLYWKREVLVNATAEDHGIILQGFVYTQ